MEKKKLFRTLSFISFVPSGLFLILLIFLGFIIGFNEFYIYIIAVFFSLICFSFPYIFWYEIFSRGEAKLKVNNLPLIQLEKEDSALWLQIFYGLGFSLLIPGLVNFPENKWFAVAGLIILSISIFIYYGLYFPRYTLLIRKSKIDKH